MTAHSGDHEEFAGGYAFVGRFAQRSAPRGIQVGRIVRELTVDYLVSLDIGGPASRTNKRQCAGGFPSRGQVLSQLGELIHDDHERGVPPAGSSDASRAVTHRAGTRIHDVHGGAQHLGSVLQRHVSAADSSPLAAAATVGAGPYSSPSSRR